MGKNVRTPRLGRNLLVLMKMHRVIKNQRSDEYIQFFTISKESSVGHAEPIVKHPQTIMLQYVRLG